MLDVTITEEAPNGQGASENQEPCEECCRASQADVDARSSGPALTLAFSGLVCAQIWEDPEIDMEALALKPDDRLVAIASGGCNVMSYLTANPAAITAVDLNRHHIALNQLKIAAARHLSNT